MRRGAKVCKGMPGCQVPELNTFKGWSKDRMMPMRTWIELRTRIGDRIEDFGWEECKKAAVDLHLEYEQVCLILKIPIAILETASCMQPGKRIQVMHAC